MLPEDTFFLPQKKGENTQREILDFGGEPAPERGGGE